MKKINEALSGKNINFLIGSGAIYSAYKTLSLGENKPSLEDLLSSENIDADAKKFCIIFILDIGYCNDKNNRFKYK